MPRSNGGRIGHTLPNPFTPLCITKKLGSTENSGPESRSTPAPPSSTLPSTTNPGPTPVLTCQTCDALCYANVGGMQMC